MGRADRRVSANAKCPFYMADDATRIRCEGVTRGSTTVVTFDTKLRKEIYTGEHCNQKYHTCRIAAMLMRMYRGEGE